MPEETFVDSIIRRIKNHKIFAIVILAGVSLIAFGKVTDSLTKIDRFSRQLFGLEKPHNPDLILINRQLRPVYFDLDIRFIGNGSGSLIAGTNQGDPFGRSSNLDKEGVETLKKYAELLKGLSVDYTLLIEGHTSRRAREANIVLAQTRVENVRSYLQHQGIPLERMKTVSFGGEEWEGENSEYTERVEFHLFINKQ